MAGQDGWANVEGGGERASRVTDVVAIEVLIHPAGPLPGELVMIPLPDVVLDRIEAARHDRDAIRTGVV